MGKAEPGVMERDRATASSSTPLSLQGRGTGAQRQGEGSYPRRGKTPEDLLARSRAMRAGPTDAEARLSAELRAGRLAGFKFRRQVPIGRYIADFVCPGAAVSVEIDGSQHAEAVPYDARRTRFLEAEGYRVLRVWNNDVYANMNGVLTAILEMLRASPLPARSARLPSPLQGEGVESGS